MQQVIGKVTIVEEAADGVIRMAVEAAAIARKAEAGQFVHILCDSGLHSLLRRPLSIHGVEGDAFQILFKVKGEGTGWLAARRPGDPVDLIGPLGRSFTLPESGPVVLVAGGLGVAPLVFAAQLAMARNLAVTVFLGARTKEMLLADKKLAALGAAVTVATEDGSAGHRGLITEVVARELASLKPAAILACGPEPMLRAMARLAQTYHLLLQVSLESRMACGIGACRGCVVPRRTGPSGWSYATVCSDGPVFAAEEVFFDA